MIDPGVVFLMAAIAMLVIVYIAIPFRKRSPEDKEALIEKWIRDERNQRGEDRPSRPEVCPFCGEPVRERDRFCPNCGKKLSRDEDEI